MQLLVVDFKPSVGTKLRGFVSLVYNGLEMYLKVKQYKKERLYVEFPIYTHNNKPVQPLRMSKKTNELFQKEVLKQLSDKYQLKVVDFSGK
jgi:hypothetical protein